MEPTQINKFNREGRSFMKELEVIKILNKYLIGKGRIGVDELDSVLNTNLFENNILDSIAIIELISFIEEEYEIDLDLEELENEENQTLRGLARMIVAAED